MMKKNLLSAVALVSVALWTGCATGGGGHTGGNIQVTVSSPGNQNVVGVTLTLQFSAKVTGTDNTAVTWSLNQSGAACTAACGTLSSNGLYTAPSTPPTPAKVDITATSVANPTKSDSFEITVFPITVTVTPGPASVGIGLQQQFSGPVTPDSAPQAVSWGISATDCPPPNNCGSIDPVTGLYSAPNSIPAVGPFSIEATSSIDPPNSIGVATVTIVSSRMSGPYAFRFSGYDDANKPVALAGNFVANNDGTIQGGTQDELTAVGHNRCTILSTSRYTVDANNHGTLTLKTSSGACSVNARSYNFVLNAGGDGQMIEFDSIGRGSGRVSQATTSAFKNSALTGGFAFGLTGSNILTGKRAGSAGFFVADGAGHTSTGLLDINDGGGATSSSNVTGSYNIAADGSGTMTLVDNDHGAATYQFAIYVVGGKTTNATNPLTLYMISTDPLSNHPAVVGTIVFQDKTQTYDKSALNNFSVSNLTGVDSTGSHTQVSLTNASGDGNGNISASYDANNAGTIVAAKTFTSTYSATGSGRYTVDWLSPAVHFVLYLTAANRGFLLDQSSPSVYTGTMDPQPGSGFAVSEMSGTFDAATGSSGTSGASQVAMNLLMTPDSLTNFKVAGTQDETDGGQNTDPVVAPTNTMTSAGTGTITLTAPAATKYVIYALDNPGKNKAGFLILHFEMIDVDPANTNPTVIFAER